MYAQNTRKAGIPVLRIGIKESETIFIHHGDTEDTEETRGMNERSKSQQRWDHNAKALGLVGSR